MAKMYVLNKNDQLPVFWLEQIQEMLSSMAGSLRLTQISATSLRLAGSASNQMGIPVNGLWRFASTNTDATHPGGAAGVYDIVVAVSANNIVNVPNPLTDNTDYNLYLYIEPAGTVPSGNTPAANAIVATLKIGEVDWDGAKITGFTQTMGANDQSLPIRPQAPNPNSWATKIVAAVGHGAGVPIAQIVSADGATTYWSTTPSGTTTRALTVSTGGITVTGNSTITGSLTVTTFAATNTSSFGGTLTVTSGGIAVTGNSTITGTLSVTSTSTFSGTLTVTAGGVAVTGNSSITGTLSVSNALTVTAGGIAVTGNSTVTGTLTVSGAATLQSSLSVAGAATVNTLSVTGTSSFGGALTVTAGGIAATGNSTITGTLRVTSTLTVSAGGFTVTGNSTVTGTLTVSAALTVSGGGIAVTGNSSVTGTFTVSSTSSFGGTVTVTAGGIAVTGNSSITGTLSVSNTLTVTAGGYSVTGNSSIVGNLSITGTLSVAGTFTFSSLGITLDANIGRNLFVIGTAAIGRGTLGYGQLDVAGVVRASTAAAASSATAGPGVELLHDGGTGFITAYDRTNNAYMPMVVHGSVAELSANVGATVTANATGDAYLSASSGAQVIAGGGGDVYLRPSSTGVVRLADIGGHWILCGGPLFPCANNAIQATYQIFQQDNRIWTNAASFIGGSDRALKKNIKALTKEHDPLAKLKALRGVSFQWKDGSQRYDLGFIAQEVAGVFPELVAQTEVPGTGEKMLGLDKSALVAPLWEATKLLLERVENLEARLAAK